MNQLNKESEELRITTKNLTTRIEKLSNEHDDSIESISSMSSKYTDLTNNFKKLQTSSESILNKSQILYNNVNDARETLNSLSSKKLGI